MTIRATMLADSISQQGKRLRTWECVYPRFIHAEMMTHRMFSRNAASSRAIPVKRMMQSIIEDTAMPIHWGKNQPGMQARAELHEEDKHRAYLAWVAARNAAIDHASYLDAVGAHKQIVNRILEPFMHMKAVFSATEMENFWALRRHPDAQPEIRELADCMWEAEQNSVTTELYPGEWHLPYVTKEDWSAVRHYLKSNRITRDEPMYDECLPYVRKISTAMLARTSYDNHDGTKRDILKDFKLHDDLLVQTPLHASPSEHIATPDEEYHVMGGGMEQWKNPHQHGNFKGWIQYRKMLPNENMPG